MENKEDKSITIWIYEDKTLADFGVDVSKDISFRDKLTVLNILLNHIINTASRNIITSLKIKFKL